MEQNNPVAAGASVETSRLYPSDVFSIVTGQLDHVVRFQQDGALSDHSEACVLAAANGQLAVLQYLHRSGCDLQAIAQKAFVLAAANGRLEVVRYLHENGCDIRAADNAAIKVAAAKNQLSVLKFLHEQGADLAACREIAEWLPESSSNRPCVDYLAAAGINPAGSHLSDLLEAIRGGAEQQVRVHLKYVDLKRYSAPLLRAAVQEGSVDGLAFLHQQGCDIQAGDNLAFRTAAETGNVAILEYLQGQGADIHANSEEAVRLAAENGHLRALVFLAEHGADISRIGEETLALAQFNGHARVFDYLTNSGGLDAISRHRSALVAMRDELNAAKSVYRPSKLWDYFNDVNMKQLQHGGMNTFKRSVNQNYFNFIPHGLLDPQLLTLLSWWIGRPTVTPFATEVIDPDVDPADQRLLPINRRIFTLANQSRLTFAVALKLGLDPGRRLQLALYRWLLATLWDFVIAHDKLGLANGLAEPRLGSPIEVIHDGKLVSQDLGHSILECNSLAPALKTHGLGRQLRIAEVGAGYGRLAYALLKASACQYLIFDIPPSLAISQWYLSNLFPGKRIFHFRHFERFDDIANELVTADIAFFTANQIELLPEGYVDLSINISSLHEMRPEQIENMLAQIYRITSRFVYLKQYREYINPYDNLKLLEDSYKTAAGWRDRFRRTDATDSRFFEALIEKEAVETNAVSISSTRISAAQSAPTADSPDLPTVSILLATYNHAQYLPTALAGILGQTHPATEILIVDDGSTDDSVAVIEEFATRFPNIRLLRNGRNRGQHHSIQRALLEARGEFVVWAASDDLLLPAFLELSLRMLKEHPDAGLCFSRLSVFVDGTTEVRHFTGQTRDSSFDYGDHPRHFSPRQLEDALRESYVWMSGNTVVARRSALLEMGGFERSLRWHADWFAFYVVALRYGACVIPETLALMRERKGTYSGGGIADPQQQNKVLATLLDIIKSPKYRDLLPVFNRRPSLLALFGKRGIYAALRNPRHWRTAWALIRWHGPRYLRAKYRQLRDQRAAR